ncbi:MAG: NAD-dependent epimerase/dehydratase family protein, partial [Acidimicrobiales bacterium]
MSTTVVIAGAAGPLGRRVAALAAADDDVARVLAVGPGVVPAEMPPSIETRALALDDPELKGFLAEADVLVHLGSGQGHGPDGLPASASASSDLAETRALLDAAAAVGIGHVVTLSSAMVYGAWANNPVPLTEDAPLRPDPGLPYASAKAESERLVFEWRAAQSGPAPRVAVLRPAVSVSGESTEWLTTSPWSAAALRASGTDRPSQFLHLDDLASAVDHARREGLDGPFNVAPDGWLPADVLRDLAGPVGRLHLPAGISGRLATMRADIGSGGPPQGWAYTR